MPSIQSTKLDESQMLLKRQQTGRVAILELTDQATLPEDEKPFNLREYHEKASQELIDNLNRNVLAGL